MDPSVTENVQTTGVSHETPNDMPDLTTNTNSSESPEDSEQELEETPLKVDTNVQDDHADHEEVFAFSISRAQSYLKSPKTPAAEKAKVLDGSHNYFATIANLEETSFDGSPSPQLEAESIDTRLQAAPSNLKDSTVPPQKVNEPPRKRSSVSRALLGQSLSLPRRRASSGPSIGESFRKLLPDVSSFFPKNTPAVAGFGYGARVREFESDEEPTVKTTENEAGEDAERRVLMVSDQKDEQSIQKTTTQETTPISTEKGDQTPSARPGVSRNTTKELLSPTDTLSGKLRRSTSETSLYLRRTQTGSSSLRYDDTSAFADVSQQVNSRFKAIQDTWDDSVIAKMVKMPSISIPRSLPFDWLSSDSQSQGSKAVANETAQNTKRNEALPAESGTEGHTSKRAHPIIHRALSKLSGDVLVMGGYRGSILRSAEPPHRQLWVPVKVGLNIRKVDLEVGLTDEDEERMPEKIFASGILAHIGPVDISRRLLRHLRKCPSTKSEKLRVHDYGYDWRLSPERLSQQLIKYLEGLECNKQHVPRESRGAWVIAHSLGGLITRHAVNQRPELFAGVVYAGTPQTCVNILGPLRNGDDVLLSSRVLTAQTNFSFRTSFALLPEDGRCFLDKCTGERYDIDFFNPQTYDEYRLTPCINPPLPALPKSSRKSIVGAMSSALSETLSSSLPNRRGSGTSSWFGSGSGRSESQPQAQPSDAQTKAEDAKETVRDTARDITHLGGNPASDALEPTNMSSNQLSKSIFSSSSSSSDNTHRSASTSTSVATTCTIPRAEAMAYLTRTLSSVSDFKSALRFNPAHQESNSYPPLAFIFGKTVPTVYGARVESREAIKRADAYDDLAFAAGDGVVLASAAQLPKGYRCVKGGRVETDRGHVGLLGDLEGVGRALEAVARARERGVGLGMGMEVRARHEREGRGETEVTR